AHALPVERFSDRDCRLADGSERGQVPGTLHLGDDVRDRSPLLVVAYSGMTPSRPSWVPSSRVGAAPAVSTGAPVTVTGLVARAHQEISRPELATVLSPSSQLIELTTKSAFDAALSTNITSIAPSVLLQTSDIVGKVATSFAGELGGVVPIVGQ